MMCLDLDDKIMERARIKRIGTYSKVGTNIVLWGGLGYLIIIGTIGLTFIGELMVIGIANRGTKWIIKNRKIIFKKTAIE
jgi:hypothetical protein